MLDIMQRMLTTLDEHWLERKAQARVSAVAEAALALERAAQENSWYNALTGLIPSCSAGPRDDAPGDLNDAPQAFDFMQEAQTICQWYLEKRFDDGVIPKWDDRLKPIEIPEQAFHSVADSDARLAD